MERYRREKPKNSWQIVQDGAGRIMGKYFTRSPMLDTDVQIVKNFLCEIQKEQKEMTKQQNDNKSVDRCNMVFLAGVIRALKVRDDGSAFMLIDPEGETKYIPCTIHDDKELARRLGRFNTEDVIQIRGYVRAWSQKKNNEWKNNVEVRITEIKSEPPKRREPERAQQQTMQQYDDDVPF